MSTIIRHILTGILFSILLTVAIITLLFTVFSLGSYTVLWETEIGNVSFLIWLAGFVLVGGTIFGISTGWYWRQRLHRIERKLDRLSKGQRLDEEKEPYHELKAIEKRLELIQSRIDQQTENAQKIATERAEEREKSLQEIVVQERNRLARELHDSVSQQLFAASMMISAINLQNFPENDEMKRKLQLVEKMLQQSQLEMRALLLHLRPVALKGKTLVQGVEELLVEMQQKVSMDITWTAEELAVDKGIEDQLFRIIQEAMSNTLRHARATSFHVLLIKRDETVILRISDDGIGFDMEQVHTGSYGLHNMRERAYEIGGTFKIVSLPNQGTKLEVKVPLPAVASQEERVSVRKESEEER
ncbi:sensor histidine kinase [Oceanobacillus alkalisoli]|uniref:sensor histidine kinase n=1 Tax=Oceanobacillus alkalisoli TaxID=2925113 RepID=UPI001EEFBDB5|nr:sensor histidine kinase [Oceanobacillus alkalisoli]MCF3943216.1 sensor histidine kinase [Oceanobacillus alkalisoli]MCG5103906.1 sensor histidine kinase [Oceanobacillus alkalisoli]